MNKSLDWSLFEEYVGRINDLWETEAWQKVNHHDHTNGLSQKAVNSYRREHPGSKLKTAVTTKPSKLKAGSKAAKRRKSFCARMSGNKGPMKKPNGKPTPKALALRRWHCESIEEMAQLIETAERVIIQEKWSQKYKSSINCSHPKGFSQKAHCAGKKKHNESHEVMEHVCPDCGMCQSHGSLNEIKKGAKDSNGFTKCWPGKHAAGTKKGKNGGQVRNCVPNESVAEAMSQRNRDQGAIGHGLPWKSYDDLDQLAQDISDKILTITNIVKLNNMAHDSTIYNALERYFKKYGYPDNVFNRVASIVFKKLDDEGRRMTTDPRIQEEAKHGLYYNVNKRKKAGQVRNCVPNESMLPASAFTGSDKNKINGKGMLRKGPAKPGKLVGGG
jgi:hypothetical protein